MDRPGSHVTSRYQACPCGSDGVFADHRYFRAATGQAFISHLNRFRIARAQQLIATADLTIAAIGQEVGFCDQSYFGVVFRRFVGMTPREYRDRLHAA